VSGGRVAQWARRRVSVLTGDADRQRHALVARRFPGTLALRTKAVPALRKSMRDFPDAREPRRDAGLSAVLDGRTLELWADSRGDTPHVIVPWRALTGVGTRAFDDYLVPDLVTADGGYVTHLLVLDFGPRSLEFPVWGDGVVDESTNELDDYGLRTVVAKVRAVRPSS
jgi:hypothetical protein